MNLIDYIKECDKGDCGYFYTPEAPPYNDDCFGITNNYCIKNLKDRIIIVNELNKLLKQHYVKDYNKT